MEADARPPRSGLLIALVLVLSAAAYASASRGPFVWDDRLLVLQQPAITGEAPLITHFYQPFWHRGASVDRARSYYRPLTTATLALDWRRGGGASDAFHLTNVLLHLVVTALVFTLARSVGASPLAATLGAVLFATFPRLTEAVAWISGRTDVLAGLFALAALSIHLRAPERVAGRSAAAFLLLLALLSKESGVAAAAAIGAYEVQRARVGRTGIRSVVTRLTPAAVAMAAYAALRSHALGGVATGETTPLGFLQRAGAATQTVGRLGLMILDPFRPRLQIGILGQIDMGLLAMGSVTALALVLLCVAAIRRRFRPETCAVIAFALAPIAAVLHLIPIHVNVLTADRFLYVPAAGIAVAAARGASGLPTASRRTVAALAAVLAVAFPLRTFARNADWQDEIRLWRIAVETTPPENVVPEHELGNALFRRGLYREALGHYRRAADRARGELRWTALGNVASALSELGSLDEARAIALRLTEAEPELPLHRYNLALIEARRLEFDAAEQILGEAISRYPEYDDARRALAVVREVRAAWSALPPETAGESVAIHARRAHMWDRLGVSARAAIAWADVAASPAATPAELRDAAVYLAMRGPPESAQIALRRAKDAGSVSLEEVQELAQAIAARQGAE